MTLTRHDISLQVKGGDWSSQISGLEDFVAETAQVVLNWEPRNDAPKELSVVLADDDFIRGLNAAYRDRDSATNVLSFPASEDFDQPSVDGMPVLLGDVVLAFETCLAESEAIASETPFAHHTRHLLVHGILHLLGFDHENNSDAEEMEGLETKILATFGVADPYL